MDDLVRRSEAQELLACYTEKNNLGHTPYQIVSNLPSAGPNWIPIVEHKPTENMAYIVRRENGAIEVCNFDTSADEFGDWEPIFNSSTGGWVGADFHRADGITHWLDFQIPVLETPEILPF